MSLFSIDTLKTIFPQYVGESSEAAVESIMTDSRKVQPNSLFIPIIGERFDAHDFIESAIEHGAIATLWAREYPVPTHLKNKCFFFYVDDTVEGLQTLASYYRKRINPTVIGITGSNGKTTTKDLLAAMLETTYKTHKTAGNLNNHIGLPLTILSMPSDTEMLVLEMGMNNFGEIDLLTRIAKPEYAIITNIGESHIEHLGSREGIAKAKQEILNGLHKTGIIVIDGDEPLLQDLPSNQDSIAVGFEMSKEQTLITDVEVNLNETTFTVDQVTYKIPLTGAHHAKNASYAIMIAKEVGLTETQMKHGLHQIEYSQMRFEKIVDPSGATLINDAYNASPTSMMGAIEVIRGLDAYEQKIVVLGDIFELGKRAIAFHEQIGKSITKPIDIVYTFGEHAEHITNIVREKEPRITTEHFSNHTDLINQLKKVMDDQTIVLFKASRGMAFENIIETLTKRSFM